MEPTHKLVLPPGPKSLVPGRVFRDLRKGPLEFFTRLTQQYGDVSSFRAAGQLYVIVNNPDLARDILMAPPDLYWKGPVLQNSKGLLGEGLLTAEGESHRRQRKLMQPAFHAKHVETYADAIVQSTDELLASWRDKARPTETLDVRPEMMGLTLVIAGRALFGTLLADDIATVHRCMDDLMNNFRRAVVPWGKLLNLVPLPSTLRLRRARNDLFALVNRMIAARRADTDPGKRKHEDHVKHDLLSMMIAATDDDGSASSGRRMTDAQLRDQAVTILTAGHETTANAMTFALYLLAQHPAVQEKLRAEIRAVLGDRRMPELADLERLTYTRWVLSESMRLYPPAWAMGRQNRRAVEIGGFRVPARSTILILQWTLHRDARFFPDPLAFVPERWEAPRHPRYAYMPFSTGPRNCIGESFAWLEMMLVLPMLMQAYRFALPADAEELKLTPAVTLRPGGPVRVIVDAIGRGT